MANNEVRPTKVVKKSSAKKPAVEIVEVADSPTIEGSMSPDVKQQARRAQGIVIDGKTYTCATCKTGHRVGICKHAKDRPMRPTHPPGRPPAGAPKKIICDCPKNCSCAKKDCRCARNCNCTQLMYMLVYVPAPEEDEDPDEEKGEWKLGEQVTTDLKGNVLSPEEIKKRQEQKDARKLLPASSASETDVSNDVKSESVKSCCKHKETIAIRNIAAQASPQSNDITKTSADGCNCGHTCTCAFCPQHPNNSTSTNVARQQAVYFANHQFANDQQIVPFLPAMPQGVSCMGGQPRFAISRNATRPSFAELQRTFPNPGYVIGYPIWSHRANVPGFTMGSLSQEQAFVNDMGLTSLSSSPAPISHAMYYTPQMTPLEQPLDFNLVQNDFGIGNAFVASAGNGVWDNNLMSPNTWSMEPSNVTTPFDNLADPTTYMTPLPLSVDMQAQSAYSINHVPLQQPDEHISTVPIINDYPDLSTSDTVMSKSNSHSHPRSSCCNSAPTDTGLENAVLDQYFTPIRSPPVINQYSHLNGAV